MGISLLLLFHPRGRHRDIPRMNEANYIQSAIGFVIRLVKFDGLAIFSVICLLFSTARYWLGGSWARVWKNSRNFEKNAHGFAFMRFLAFLRCFIAESQFLHPEQ
jgi:hypothetical protein